MRSLEFTRSTSSCVLIIAILTAGCAPRMRSEPPDPASPRTPIPGQQETVTREVPYEGAFGPSDPPMAAVPATQTPLEPWVAQALDVLYERPSPEGPPPIPLAQPKAIYVVGQGPVIQALPGPAAFPDRIPERVRTAMPQQSPYIRLVAFDRTLNDTKRSADSMAIEVSFTDAEGAEWRIEQVTLAPISSNPVAEPWFGGLIIDTLYHGQTGNGTPAEPLVNCAMCSWGWADIYKNHERVASSALLHVMVTSDVRDDDNEFAYACYECADQPVREVHLLVPPMFYLPSPGGFLHIVWENAEIVRGTPTEVESRAPQLAEEIPTIEISAVPYMRWDQEEIHIRTGQKYRLIVHNNDPSAFHQFSLHSEPTGAHGGGGRADLRHEEGMTSGRTGRLWKPGGAEEAHGDPPAPRNVFLTLPQGATWATMVTFEEPGDYEFMCPVGNHYRRGMEGKFIVSDGSAGAERVSPRVSQHIPGGAR